MCIVSIGTIKEFFDYYHEYLSVNIDTKVVVELMLSQQLVNKCTLMASSSDYQTNCLLLERMRQLTTQQFTLLCNALTTTGSQTLLGNMLEKGEIDFSATLCIDYMSYFSTDKNR